MEDAARLEALDLEDRLTDLRGCLGEQVGDLAAHHLRDDGRGGRVLGAVRGDVRAVAHHGDRVAQVEDLVEAVRDEDEGSALVAQAAGHGEEALDLDPAEGGGRLVHDEEPRLEGDRLGDLDDLLVGDGQAPGRSARVEVDAQPAEEALRLGVHRRPVDAAAAAEELAPHEDVLHDREVGEERRLLVDHRDACVLGVGRRAEVDAVATEQEVAAVAAVHAGDDLDQRRLAGAVLPHQGVDRAGVDAQAAGAQGDDRAERLRDVAQLEHGGAAAGHGASS